MPANAWTMEELVKRRIDVVNARMVAGFVSCDSHKSEGATRSISEEQESQQE